MRKLRLLTRIYDVPLIFDEVQTGWGMTGRLWAHELFDLPCPPDVVTWAKKAQNGVLFVSEELATFFQEEKKFNTTWEGDSVGMVRLLALLDKLDLDQVRRTGERARSGLEALAREYREILKNVRGAGVMLGFDVVRADWCDALLDRAFRRGLVLLPAGERSVRFYPRYDTEPSAIDEALSILRAGDRGSRRRARGAGRRAGAEDPRRHAGHSARHGRARRSDAGRLRDAASCRSSPSSRSATAPARSTRRTCCAPDRGPLLQFPLETLEATVANAARDRHRAARSRLGPGRRLRARQRAREPRRGRRRLGSAFRREQHVLPAGDGHAAHGAELGRARELSAGFAARARDRRRVRVSVDADRGPAARHRSSAGCGARRSWNGSTTTCAAAPVSRTFRSRCSPSSIRPHRC